MAKNGNGNSTQHQLLFRVPNNSYGKAFIEWSKSFLNTDSYRLKVRGVDGKSLNDKSVKTLRVYLMAKTPNGVKTVGVQEANHIAGRQQFYQDAYRMKTVLSSIGI
tara:strand:+ start:1251 stop:1568 length:318 start_codon:yes stop_codon:yes gene_type:complete